MKGLNIFNLGRSRLAGITLACLGMLLGNVAYCANLVATSPEFKLSLRDDGIRQSTGVETLTFGSLWDGDENATVTIERDGVAIAENLTGSGDKEWRVTESGTYKLTHTTYTNGIASKVETATFVVSDQVATSPEFKLSLRDDGIRQSTGVETLTFGSLWDGDENATVTIEQDGVVIAENLTGEGDKEWRVTEDGTYKLTHTTYTNGVVSKVETATFVVSDQVATSPEFKLSLQDDGIRLSDGSEPLSYSSLWDGDENATVTIEQDGVTIAKNLTGSGDKEWRVTEEGTYTLTHTTYTNGIAGKIETATFVVAGLSVEFPDGDVSIDGYTGKYDGLSHGITASVSDKIDGAVIKYSTSENGEFSLEMPTLTDVGTKTVWCEIAAPGYITKTNSATINIAKRAVTLTSASETKVYDGTALKAESVTVGGDGFADGEGATYTFTGSQMDVGTSDNSFTYALNSNTKAGNYDITTANGTLTVTAADISADAVITLDANPKYNGKEQEIAVNSVTYKGLPVTYTASSNKATDAGDYTLTIAGTGNFTGSKTAQWSIAKRAVTLTSASNSKVYDGTALKAESVTVGGDGFADGEGATYTFTGSQTNVGTSDNSFTYTLNGNTKAGNYDVTTVNGKLTVTKADISADAVITLGANPKYNGKEQEIAVSSVTYKGLPVTYTASGNKATDAGSYTLTITANGNFAGSKTAKWSIGKRSVTLTSASDSKVYDGTALKAESITVGGDGFADGEGATYTFTGSQTDVGTSENGFTYALNNNTKAGNYDVTTANGKLTVTAADISADAVITLGANPKYDGKEQEIAVNSVTYKGLPVTYTASGNKATDAGSYTLTITANGNFAGSKTAKWSIGKRALTLTSATETKVYDGTALKAESVTVGGDGFANGEGATYLFTGSQTDVGTSENGFTYTLNGNTKAGNYDVTTANGKLTVTAADISADAVITLGTNPKYDGKEQEIAVNSVTYKGLPVTFTASGNKATDAGSYTLTITANGNFAGSKTAKWSIAKRAVTLTSATETKVYDGTALKAESVTVSGDGFANGEGAAYTFTGSQTDVGTSENGFTYALNSNTKAGNYDVTTANGTLTVTKAKYPGQESGGTGIAWNVAMDAATWMYDGAEHGVALTGVPSGVTAKLTGNSAVDAGTYTASVVLEYDELNYEAPVAPQPIEWSITRRPITLMAASKDKPYDGFPLEVKGSDITASGSGYAPGECFEYYDMASITEVGEIAATFSYRDSSTAKVSNYDVTVVGGQTLKVTVGGDQISVTADSAIWAYDGTEHSLKSWKVINGDKLLSGHELQAKISDDSVITTPSDGDNGIVSNRFEYVKIVDRATGADRTRNYNLFVYEGSLQVTNATIHAEQLSGITDISKTYDGITSKVAVGAELLQPATIKYSLGDSGVWSDSAPEFVNAGNYTVGFTVDADYYHSYTSTLNVAIAKRPLKFTSPTKAKPYDGTALTFNGSEIEVDGVVNGEGFIFSNFASITDSGRIDSTFDYEAMEGTLASNYDIAINNGSLTIRASADEIAVTANDATWVYDGTKHSSHTYTVENGNKLQPGDELVVTFSEESVITTPEDGHLGNGIVSNIITSVKVMRNGTTDVSSNYTLVWYPGMLSVTKAKMVVDGSNFSREFTYDGEGHTITVAPPTLLTSPVTVSYGISSDAITSDAAPLFRDAGTYTVYYSISAKYYESYTGSAVVTIKPRPVTLISSAAEKVYDGSPLKKDEVLVKDGSLGFVNGEGYTATCTGALTDVGGMENLFDYTFINGTKSDNYIITKEYGWLRVTPATVDASVVFGGDMLTCKRVFNGMAQKVQLSPVFSEAYKLSWALVSGDESAYGDAAPTLTNVSQGELDVFFKFVSPNYKPYYGKVVFSITPKTLTADNVTLVTQASDCLYDGTEKKPTFTLTDGSPSIITADDISVAYNNNVDAGVAIAKFTGKGNYTGIVSKDWNIAKRAVTLTSASDSKVYDGTALKGESVTVGGDGFANGEGATYTFTGSQTDVGTSDNSFTYTLNNNTKAGNYDVTTANGKLTVTAADISADAVITLGANPKYNGKEQEIAVNSVTYKGLPVTFTASGNKATDVGNYTLTITANGNFAGSKTAQWSIAKRSLTLTSASETKVYDGTALKAESVTVGGDGFANGEGATYTFTGSQTDVGTSENGFTYTLNGNTKASNYDVTTANGTLTVTAADISADAVITLGANPKYSGVEQEIAVSSVTYKGLPVTFTAFGNKATDAGSYTLTITATGNFAGTKTAEWSITKRAVTLTSASDTKVYDGTALKAESVTVSGDGFADGEGATYTFTGSQTDVGTSENGFTYALNGNTKAGNYDVTTVNGTLTVTAADISADAVITLGANPKYDGKEQEIAVSSVTYKGLPVTFTASGNKATDAGDYTLTIVGTGNFTGSKTAQWSIGKRVVTLTSASDSKVYDGTALKAESVTVGGDGFADGEGATYTFTGSQTNVGTSENGFTYTLNNNTKAGNYDITTANGTLIVTAAGLGGDEEPGLGTIPSGGISKFDTTVMYDSLGHTVDTNAIVAAFKTAMSNSEIVLEFADTFGTGNGGLGEPKLPWHGVIPTLTNVGERIIWYRVSAANFEPFTHAAIISVTNRPVTVSVVGKTESHTYDGTSKSVEGYDIESEDLLYDTAKSTVFTGLSKVSRTDAGKTTMGLTKANFVNNDSNFAVTYNVTDGWVEIAAADISSDAVITLGANPKYNGKEQEIVVSSVTYKGLPVTFTASGNKATDAGDYTLTIAGTGNFTGSKTAQWSIGKRVVTLTSASETKVYDGTALKAESVTVGGDGFADGEGATYTFTGSQTDVGTSENTFAYRLNANTKAGNYDITTANGTLTVTTSAATDDSKWAVTLEGDNAKYDGTEKTVTVSALSYDGVAIPNYTITGNKATDAGAYTLTITANGNFAGSKTADWSIGKRVVTLTSATETKVYDGAALKAESVTVGGDGFANGEGATYIFTGSQTDVGTSENGFTYTLNSNTKAGNYDITTANGTLTVTTSAATDGSKWAVTLEGDNAKYDGTEKTVTVSALSYDGVAIPNYTITGNKATDAGTYTLTITANGNFVGSKSVEWSIAKRTVTLTSASDSKVYDGTALKAESVTVGGDGFADGEGATYTFTGSQTDVGTSDNSFSYTLNNNTKAGNYDITTANGKLTVTASGATDESKWSIRLEGDNAKYDGTEKTVTVSALSYDGVAIPNYTVTGNKATDAGSYTLTITASGNFAGTKSVEWSIARRAVTLTSASDSKVYDGTALKAESVTVGGDGFVNGEGATYTFTGSQMDVGTSDNSFTYTLNGNTKAGNYDITTANGKLTVTTSAATDGSKWAVTLEGDNAKYDGTEKTVTVSALSYDGVAIPNYTVTGNKAIDAGTYTLTITATGNFIGTKTAEWSIAKRSVTLTSASDSKVYDGTALNAESVTVGGDGFVNGEGATYTFTGSQTDVGTSENSFTYTLNGNTKASNYDVTTANGTITVTTSAATDGSKWAVTLEGDNAKYDGTEKTVTVSALSYDGVAIPNYTITGNKATDAGNYTLTITATGNFIGTKTADWSITKRSVTLTSASDSKVYDGTALKAESVTVGGDGFADGEGATYTFTGSQTNVGTSDNSFTYILNGNTKADNYDVTTANGTLTVVLPPTVELKIDLSKTVKGKGEWGNVRLLTNSIPLTAAVAGTITSYTINVGANVDLAFVPNEGFRIYGTQAGNGPFTSTTNYSFVAMTNSTYSATFQPAPKTSLAWKYAKNKNGWFCAQISLPGYAGYSEAFENPRFLFADRVNSQNARTSYLVDTSTVIDPLGTTEVYGNTTYRKVVLSVSAFAGKVNGARVVFGVSEATMSSSVDSVPVGERTIALRVVNRNINSVELLDNVIGYFAWDCCGETFYQPLGGKQSPGVILTKLLSIRTLNNAAAFGIDPSAVAPEYVNCRFTSFNIANGKFIGTFEVVAESDEGTKAAVKEISSSVDTLLLGSESPAGPFEPIGDEVKDITFDVDNAPFTFQGTLPQKYKFFRLNLNIEELYK